MAMTGNLHRSKGGTSSCISKGEAILTRAWCSDMSSMVSSSIESQTSLDYLAVHSNRLSSVSNCSQPIYKPAWLWRTQPNIHSKCLKGRKEKTSS